MEEIVKYNRRARVPVIADEVYGKIPPQAKELEEAVLGAMLLEDCAAEVSVILKPECFYIDAHQRIYSAMIRLFTASKPIDNLTVIEELKRNGELDSVGGHFFVAQLSSKIGSSAHVEYHCSIIKEKWVQRALIASSSEILKDAYDDQVDPFELIERASKNIDNINAEISLSQSHDFASVLEQQVEDIDVGSHNPQDKPEVLGLPTGLYALDRKILGFNAPDLVLAAARPGEGKTSFALQVADSILSRGIPLGFISIEMTLKQLNLKLLSLNTGISVERLRLQKLNREELDKLFEAKRRLQKYPFYVFDKPCDPDMAKSIFKTWKKKHGIQMGILDYVQRMKVPKYLRGQNSDAVLTVASNALKDTCLSLEMPILELSQMSREIEGRSGAHSRPQLTDLRGSGSLEQDADIVVFVYRPEMHKIMSYEDGTSTKGCTEFIIEKSRLGSLGTIRAKFDGAANKFDDSDFSSFNSTQLPETTKQLTLTDEDDLPF